MEPLLEQAKAELGDAQDAKNALDREAEAIQAQIDALAAKAADAQTTADDLDKQITDKEAILDAAQASYDTLKAEINELNAQIATLTDAIAELNAQGEKARLDATASVDAALKEKADAIAEAQATLDSLNAQLPVLQMSIADNEAALLNLDASVRARNDDVATLKTTINDLQSTQTALTVQNTGLSSQLDTANKGLAEVIAKTQAAEDALATIHADTKLAQEILDGIHVDIATGKDGLAAINDRAFIVTAREKTLAQQIEFITQLYRDAGVPMPPLPDSIA